MGVYNGVMNRVQKGNRTKNKIAEYFINKGYIVANVEFRTRFAARDTFGSDLVARNEKETLWISCKSNKTHISKGKKELLTYGVIPPATRLLVVVWEDREKEPRVIEC